MLNEKGFIGPVVAEAREEDSAGKEGNLQGADVDVHAVFMPGVGSNGVGGDRSEEAVEVEEKEDGEETTDDEVYEEREVEARAVVPGLHHVVARRHGRVVGTAPPACVWGRSIVGREGLAFRR